MTAEPVISTDAPVHDDSDLSNLAGAAATAAGVLMREARGVLAARVSARGRVSGQMLEAGQYAAHGLAWLATYAESLRQMAGWAARLEAAGKFGEIERLISAFKGGRWKRRYPGASLQ